MPVQWRHQVTTLSGNGWYTRCRTIPFGILTKLAGGGSGTVLDGSDAENFLRQFSGVGAYPNVSLGSPATGSRASASVSGISSILANPAAAAAAECLLNAPACAEVVITAAEVVKTAVIGAALSVTTWMATRKSNDVSPRQDGAEGSGNASSERVYSPTAKHAQGGWGTEMDLDDEEAKEVLNQGQQVGKQVYGRSSRTGKIYEFQPDGVGGWHGYSIPGNEAPSSVLKDLRDRGVITNSEYKRLVKGK